MAGVTSPTMMNGTINLMNCAKVEPNELRARMTHAGANAPTSAPTAIAASSLANGASRNCFDGIISAE